MISKRIKKYFHIKELVCKHVFNTFGEGAWNFLDKRLLETMLVIREELGKPVHVNNWANGGGFSQRGLRCNVCALVKEKTLLEKVYLSAHIQGIAIDFDVEGMTAKEVRSWMVKNQHLLPYPIRLEDGVTWVHLDMRNNGAESKIAFFKS